MADTTFKKGQTWPPLRGTASDEGGLMDLTVYDSVEAVLVPVSGAGVQITGPAEPIDPPELDADGVTQFNWRYVWATGDTDVVGEYRTVLRLTDANGVEYVPNTGGPTVAIEEV